MISENLTCKSILYLYTACKLRNNFIYILFNLCSIYLVAVYARIKQILIYDVQKSALHTFSFSSILLLSVILSFSPVFSPSIYTCFLSFFSETNTAINTGLSNAGQLWAVFPGFLKPISSESQHSWVHSPKHFFI